MWASEDSRVAFSSTEDTFTVKRMRITGGDAERKGTSSLQILDRWLDSVISKNC